MVVGESRFHRSRLGHPYLDITRATIQIEMQILNLAKIAKLVRQILLAGLFVYVADDNDPSLNGAHRSGIGVGDHGGIARLFFLLVGGSRWIQLHLRVRHDCVCIVSMGSLWWMMRNFTHKTSSIGYRIDIPGFRCAAELRCI